MISYMGIKNKKMEKKNYSKGKATAKPAKTGNHASQSNSSKADQNAITNMSCYRYDKHMANKCILDRYITCHKCGMLIPIKSMEAKREGFC